MYKRQVRHLDRTVDYVQNKAKTTPKSLEEAVDYAATVSYTHLDVYKRQPVLDIDKTDIAGNLLPGATLTISDAGGEVIDTWVTD